MTSILLLLTLAVLSEAITEGLGAFAPSAWRPALAMAVGVALCLATCAGLLAAAGVPLALPYIDPALSGLVVGRGASYVHDAWARLRAGPALVAGELITAAEPDKE